MLSKKSMALARLDRITSETNYFTLPVFAHFDGRPVHVRTMWAELDLSKLREGLTPFVFRSEMDFDPSPDEGEPDSVRRLLLRPDKDVFIQAEPHGLTVYASTPELALKYAREISTRYAQPESSDQEAPYFYLLRIGQDSMNAESVEIKRPFVLNDDDLGLNYGSGIVEFERHLVAALRTQDSSASILRGEAGTGKTSFIRHLINKLQPSHRFYYLPVCATQYLSRPEMVQFWAHQSRRAPGMKKVVILEDAEDLLMERRTDNQAKVSALLNIADGLLGEFLQVHLLCTVNAPLERLDPAILRPGRLVAYRDFGRLNRQQARRLAQVKGLRLSQDQTDYTLAEIYSDKPWIEDGCNQPSIGFSKAA